MLRYRILDRSPNISVAIEVVLPNTITELNCSLNLSSAIGEEQQRCPMTGSTLDTTLKCNTEYWVTMTVSNDCGSDDTTITILREGTISFSITNFQYEGFVYRTALLVVALHFSEYSLLVSLPSAFATIDTTFVLWVS